MKWYLKRKAAILLVGSGVMFQTATTGCPDGPALLGVASTSTQSLINGVFALYVRVFVQQAFGL